MAGDSLSGFDTAIPNVADDETMFVIAEVDAAHLDATE